MSVQCILHAAFPQVFVIDAQGDAIPQLVGNLPAEDDDAIPNVIMSFVQAVNLGLLAGPSCPPSECGAELLEVSPVSAESRQRYRIALRGCDLGAFRVLCNLLDGLALDARVFTEPTEEAFDAPRIDVEATPYPAPPVDPPFRIAFDAEYGVKAALEFVRPPEDEIVDPVIAALELWSQLVAACGYPPPGKRIQLGGMPDGALLLDPYTITEGLNPFGQPRP